MSKKNKMSISEEKIIVEIICPHCQRNIKRKIDALDETKPLFCLLIKDHHKSQNCPPFIAFIDNNGMHRGSEKIDGSDDDYVIDDDMLSNVNEKIKEMETKLRFYHLKMPRKEGRGFEHKVSNVMDRRFMSSDGYSSLINFLTQYEDNNTFGIVSYEKSSDFEGGDLIYGKHIGMLYVICWRNQKSLQNKSIDEIQVHTNHVIKKLLDMYELNTFFL